MPNRDILVATVLGIPFVCLMIAGVYVQRQGWQVYHRMGNCSIGLVTFFTQLQYPGANFPGPNVLEAQIAAQPADLRTHIQMVRRRIRCLSRAMLIYLGFFFLMVLLVRNLT